LEKGEIMKWEDMPKFLQWAFVEAAVKKNKNVQEIWPDMCGGNEPKEWDIKLVVNGVDLPLLETIKNIESQLDRMVKEQAEKMLQNKIGEVDAILTDFLDVMFQHTQEEFKKKLNVEISKGEIEDIRE
jgi:hypothetical protein